MKAITLRNMPDSVCKRIEERARKSGTSLNKTVIEMLQESDSPNRSRTYNDLDHLIGTWTAEDAREFDDALRDIRQIDLGEWT